MKRFCKKNSEVGYGLDSQNNGTGQTAAYFHRRLPTPSNRLFPHWKCHIEDAEVLRTRVPAHASNTPISCSKYSQTSSKSRILKLMFSGAVNSILKTWVYFWADVHRSRPPSIPLLKYSQLSYIGFKGSPLAASVSKMQKGHTVHSPTKAANSRPLQSCSNDIHDILKSALNPKPVCDLYVRTQQSPM